MRLFVAVYPPAAAIRDLERVVAGLATASRNAGMIRSEIWHVTVTFLGEVPDDSLDAVAAAVGGAAGQSRPGRLALTRGGRFGDTVWVGVSTQDDALADLARRVRRAVRAAGVRVERRAYHPHLTLARTRGRIRRDELALDLNVLRNYSGPEWTLDRVHLVQSQLGPTSRHTTVEHWRLAEDVYQA